jgi:hypothetical protein
MKQIKNYILGDGSIDLRLDKSTKLKMENYWGDWHHHKKQNLYFYNKYKLDLTKIFFKPLYTDILKILENELFCTLKGHFKVLRLFKTKTFISKNVNNF